MRAVDIPSIDAYRPKMTATIRGINNSSSFPHDQIFDAFIQFKEYIGFAKCMHALQSKKVVFVENDEAWSALIKVRLE